MAAAAECGFAKYIQFEFCQWSELKRYANMHGIQIIGDILTSLTIALMYGDIRKSFA